MCENAYSENRSHFVTKPVTFANFCFDSFDISRHQLAFITHKPPTPSLPTPHIHTLLHYCMTLHVMLVRMHFYFRSAIKQVQMHRINWAAVMKLLMLSMISRQKVSVNSVKFCEISFPLSARVRPRLKSTSTCPIGIAIAHPRKNANHQRITINLRFCDSGCGGIIECVKKLWNRPYLYVCEN